MKYLLNRIKTPDGTIMTSWSVHDYKTYTDDNEKTYMVDGGGFYLRRNLHDDYKELSIKDDGTHELRRKHIHWGTYGKSGRNPLRHIPIMNLETSHIKAILKLDNILEIIVQTLKKELDLRHNITMSTINPKTPVK